jgi:hypothetical protein
MTYLHHSGLAPVPNPTPNDGKISPASESGKPRQQRVSPPTFNPEADDEIALNAAAAREITLELESLNVNSTNPPDVNYRGNAEPSAERGRSMTASRADSADIGREPSPLAPPSVPFAKRAISPRPYAEHDKNKNAPYGSQPPSSPSGPYGQSYKNSSPANISPAQAYAQSYQSSASHSRPQTPEAQGPSSTLPLRFQRPNQSMESQSPPRFQTSLTHSAGSPISNQLPPRFQSGGPTQVPPVVNPGEQRGTSGTPGSESPYRTPAEYPRPLGASSAYTRSNTSLNTAGSPVAPLAPAARTISAAAFKRPRNLSADNPGDPFAKKALPSSPFLGRDSSGSGALHAPTLTAPPAEENEEDDYDYISAYVNNSNPNSPHAHRTSFDASPGQGQGQAVAGRPGGGYGDGRFATNLESGSLR